jgi:multidrug efflux pump subunit AcrB
VALTVTPYLGYHLLKVKDDQEHKEEQGLGNQRFIKSIKKLSNHF